MQKNIVLSIILFAAIAFAANGQSYLQLKYGASFPAGKYGQSTDLMGSGNAQTGLGLQAEYYTMIAHPVGLGMHYSFSFNSADYLRTGYRYAETYSNIIAGKYAMHDITGLLIIRTWSATYFSSSIRLSGGTSFVSYPEVTKRFYENEQLTSEEKLMERESGQKYLYGIGAAMRYAVSDNTGISFSIDYQNRVGGTALHNQRPFDIEQVFVLLGIEFKLGKQ